MANSIKIAAGINTFNDCKSLERCIKSLVEYVDRIYVIDGRYPDYESTENGKDKYSTDGTLELVKSFDKCRYFAMYAEQKDKRTRYMKECEYDFLLAVDADEYLVVQSWPMFQDQIQRYILNTPERHRFYQYQTAYQAEPTKTIYLARLFYRPNNLMYVTHWTMIAEPVDNRPMISSTCIEGITLYTDDNLRPIIRLKYDTDYQWNLFKKEGVISDTVYNDTECKANFVNHVVWELNAWKGSTDKIKPVSRFKKKR